jgi:hypothetical protein
MELECIDRCIRKYKKAYRGIAVMMCSDSNVQLPKQDFSPCISGALSEAPFSEKGASLLAFMHEHNLKAHNTMENTGFGQHHTCLNDAWTWRDATGARHELLDHILSDGDIGEWAVDFAADVNTDHNAILFTLPFRGVCNSGRRRRRRFCRKGWQPEDAGEAARYRAVVAEGLRRAEDLSQVQSVLLAAADLTRARYRGRQKPRVEEGDQLRDARRALREATSPVEERSAARALTRALRKHRGLCREMQLDWEALHGDRVAKSYPPLRVGGVVVAGQEQAGRCITEYYSALYNPNGETEATYEEWYNREAAVLEEGMRRSPKVPIPFSTFLDAVHALQPGKAPGADGIVNEMVSCLGFNSLVAIHRLFEERLNGFGHQGVQGWELISVHCIPKDPNPKDLKNWRPISLLPTLQKLYASCVAKLVQASVTWPPEFYGFMPGRQPLEITSAHRRACHLSLEWGAPLWWARIDVS